MAAKRSVTDRAKRYRANHPAVRPSLEHCAYCGAGARNEVEHIDGDEANASPYNLVGSCRRCNVIKGITLKAWGLGRRTKQYNPAGRPLRTMAEYRRNVAVLVGQQWGDVAAAVRRLQDTAPADRERFSAQLARSNPARRGGPTFQQWAAAMAAYGGGDQLSLFDKQAAREVLHDARKSGRTSAFQKQVWRIRKERYGPSGRKGFDDVPF